MRFRMWLVAGLMWAAGWAGWNRVEAGLPGGGPDGGFAVCPELFSGLRYRMVGPSRGGRVTAVAGHAAQPSVFYMGATGGGVWKTTDYGQTWRPISDGYFATGSIGAIQVAKSCWARCARIWRFSLLFLTRFGNGSTRPQFEFIG